MKDLKLIDVYPKMGCDTQVRIHPDSYTEIRGEITDPEFIQRISGYNNYNVICITAIRDSDIKIWIEEAED